MPEEPEHVAEARQRLTAAGERLASAQSELTAALIHESVCRETLYIILDEQECIAKYWNWHKNLEPDFAKIANALFTKTDENGRVTDYDFIIKHVNSIQK